MLNKKKNLYLAGKISRNDWRETILGCRPGAVDCNDHSEHMLERGVYNANYKQDYEDFVYVGPFFVSCDHGCFHKESPKPPEYDYTGFNEHGSGPTGCYISDSHQDLEFHRSNVFWANTKRIQSAHVCLVYINEKDCYGTLMEIGYMQATGVRFGVIFGPNSDPEEMWMAKQDATMVYHGSIEEVWPIFRRDFLPNLSEQIINQLTLADVYRGNIEVYKKEGASSVIIDSETFKMNFHLEMAKDLKNELARQKKLEEAR